MKEKRGLDQAEKTDDGYVDPEFQQSTDQNVARFMVIAAILAGLGFTFIYCLFHPQARRAILHMLWFFT